MWVAIFDFCFFVLFVSFFLYGLREWDNLLSDPEDLAGVSEPPAIELPGTRLAIWVLIFGLGGVSLIADIVGLLAR